MGCCATQPSHACRPLGGGGSNNVGNHLKTSLNVGSLVAVVAAVHYFYMREYWVILHPSPILYRYGDWSITVPLQMIEFYVIEFAMGQGGFKSNPHTLAVCTAVRP